jgi:uncharacterized YceG family protein
VPERSPEERRRAAEERAARRAGRAAEPPPAEAAAAAEPAPTPEPELRFEPARSRGADETGGFRPDARTRSVLAERPPISRAAKAQRIGRPGRPSLPPQAPKPRRWFRRLLALVALLAIGAALYVINATFQPFRSENEQAGGVAVRIPPGTGAKAIGKLLESKGVVEDARFFELNATLTLRRGKLLTGNYLLRRNMTNGAAIDALMQGPRVRVVKTFQVTIPEGLSRPEAAPRIASAGVGGSYLKASASPAALARARRLGLAKRAKSLEGFLFPATYELKAGSTADRLVALQLNAFRDNFRRIGMRAARRKNLTRYDVVTIASMIERETPSDKERPLIASVIYNRLKDGRPLSIDATIRYDLNNWSRPLKVSELERDTPYNTRTRKGLPPTPIGSPGLASLKAAAHPARTRYRFYVAKPGACHAFSRTDAQFARDVAAYEQARADNGGKAPKQKC